MINNVVFIKVLFLLALLLNYNEGPTPFSVKEEVPTKCQGKSTHLVSREKYLIIVK